MNDLTSLDVSRCQHLLADVFRLDGYIVGTKDEKRNGSRKMPKDKFI